jgi:hypothetical protein
MAAGLGIHNIIHPSAKSWRPHIGTLILSCAELHAKQRQRPYAKALTGREIGCRRMIMSVNMRIKSGSLMIRTDRTSSGHVRRHT